MKINLSTEDKLIIGIALATAGLYWLAKRAKNPAPILGIGPNYDQIDNDTYGNPRYVFHFLDFLSDEEHEKLKGKIDEKYALALKKSRALGGKKYHNKKYGGGIVFQSYNIESLQEKIAKLAKG